MPSRRAIRGIFRPLSRLKLKVPNCLKLCIPVELVMLFSKLNNSLRSSDKRLSQSTQVLPFTFPLPTSFGSLQLPANLYIFLRLFWLKCPFFRCDLKVIFALHNSVFKVILIYVSEWVTLLKLLRWQLLHLWPNVITLVTFIIFVTKCYYTCDFYYMCDQLLHLCLQQLSGKFLLSINMSFWQFLYVQGAWGNCKSGPICFP